MQREEGRFLLNFLLPQLQEEIGLTRKVIAAVPEDKREYHPEPRSRSAMELVWHIVSSETWFLDGIIQGQFSASEEKMPSQIKSVADVLEWYDKNIPGLLDRLKALSDDELSRPVPFFGICNYSAVAYLQLLIVHSVHHRGQLSTYLRPMGSRVPSIYGGSADEPFQMPAEAQPAS